MAEPGEQVCPRCGSPAAGHPFCTECGCELRSEKKLPTRAEWVDGLKGGSRADLTASAQAPIEAPSREAVEEAAVAKREEVPAGWYGDTRVPGQERYWDGQRWTEQARDVPAASQMMSPPPPGAPGKPRNPGLLLLWIFITVNVYWVYWLYQTYKEVRRRAPQATRITPAQAAGFVFIPFFNIYWAFRIAVDLPRAIARMEGQDGVEVPDLKPWLVTGLLATGFAINFLSAFEAVFYIVGELLVLTSFFVVQRALNSHWERLGAPEPASQEFTGTAIAAGAGLLLFGSLFFEWFEFGSSAWQAFSHLRWLLAALALGITALAVVGLLVKDRAPFVLAAVMAAIAAGVASPFSKLTSELPTAGLGQYLPMIASALAALGTLVVLSSQEGSGISWLFERPISEPHASMRLAERAGETSVAPTDDGQRD